MFYVTRQMSCQTINNETYETIEAAMYDAQMIKGMNFKRRGDWYTVKAGENPNAAKAEARQIVANAANAATTKQMIYLSRLGDKVDDVVRNYWIKPNMTKQQASRAIVALKDLAGN